MSRQTFYITTPIYYVNDIPHIGHAYTNIACDVIARFMRLNDIEVKYLTGTDEHGQKVENSATKLHLAPQEFTNINSATFRKMMDSLDISYDDFLRTTEHRHKNAVNALWTALVQSGNIYLGKYAGWYSVRDEAFYSATELTPEGLGPTGAPVAWIEEPSYFFALSKWQDKLLEYYHQHPDFILPESRRNEVISFVKGGLHDLSVSRTSFGWGIAVPDHPEHVIYVWLDALTNYISALGYPKQDGNFNKFWPANVHVVGKDILKFHAVYWPAFLMAADLPLPQQIFAHGWWTNEGQKISKSLGNVIDPMLLVEKFGIDRVRYFLMREVIFGNDGNFSLANLITRCNSELSNKIGNLVQRTCTLVYKNCDQAIPEVSSAFITELYNSSSIFQQLSSIHQDNICCMQSLQINKVLDNIIQIADLANSYIDQQAPWSLRNYDQPKMNEVLYTLMEMIRHIAIMLQPFVPSTARQILEQLGISHECSFKYLSKEHALKPRAKINLPAPLLPRLNTDM